MKTSASKACRSGWEIAAALPLSHRTGPPSPVSAGGTMAIAQNEAQVDGSCHAAGRHLQEPKGQEGESAPMLSSGTGVCGSLLQPSQRARPGSALLSQWLRPP